MSGRTIPLLGPVPWQLGLSGDYPGQQSFLELRDSGVRMVFCWCPPIAPGRTFRIGSPPDEAQRRENEDERQVESLPGFWLARHPVNRQQWAAVMGGTPKQDSDDGLYPVAEVSWNDAQEFCGKTGLCLPAEAEWEYACRAGTRTPFAIGSGASLNSQLANFDGNHPYGSGREAIPWLYRVYREGTLPQGSFLPNAWGLHDMHGQLWEWCEDEYSGWGRVLRGGCWIDEGRFARSAVRRGFDPVARAGYVGFRPCPSSTQVRTKLRAGGRSAITKRGEE